LRERVSVVEDADLTTAFPNHYAARVTVTMANGEVLTHLQGDAWGDPELPLSQEGLQAKFFMLFDAAGVERPITHMLLTATLALPTSANVSDWTALWPNVVSPPSARQT
jgi:2-methylcitrate dehydratase PrpD